MRMGRLRTINDIARSIICQANFLACGLTGRGWEGFWRVAHPLLCIRVAHWQDTTLEINRKVIKGKEVGGLPFAVYAKGGLFPFLLCRRILDA